MIMMAMKKCGSRSIGGKRRGKWMKHVICGHSSFGHIYRSIFIGGEVIENCFTILVRKNALEDYTSMKGINELYSLSTSSSNYVLCCTRRTIQVLPVSITFLHIFDDSIHSVTVIFPPYQLLFTFPHVI